MKQGKRQNPTFRAMKSVLGVLKPDPQIFRAIQVQVNRDDSTVRNALYGLCELGLAKVVKSSRCSWSGHSHSRNEWVKTIK